MSIIKKRGRVEHANTLIKIISDYDRRFFYNAQANRVAQFEIIKGHIYFRDDYTNKLIHVHKNFYNINFSHGGTLRDLVENMANYIRTGEHLSIKHIGPELAFSNQNIWGYSQRSIDDVRMLALGIPIIGENPAQKSEPEVA